MDIDQYLNAASNVGPGSADRLPPPLIQMPVRGTAPVEEGVTLPVEDAVPVEDRNVYQLMDDRNFDELFRRHPQGFVDIQVPSAGDLFGSGSRPRIYFENLPGYDLWSSAPAAQPSPAPVQPPPAVAQPIPQPRPAPAPVPAAPVPVPPPPRPAPPPPSPFGAIPRPVVPTTNNVFGTTVNALAPPPVFAPPVPPPQERSRPFYGGIGSLV